MSLLADVAARTEKQGTANVLARSREFEPHWETGDLPLPCHIVQEIHNGFFIRNSRVRIGIYRCQGRWWRRELDTELFTGLNSRSPERWFARVAATQPQDLGPMRGGPMETAASFAAAFAQ
jgi:hypothetical protein